MAKLNWEKLDQDPDYFSTYRAKVPGGWLVMVVYSGGAGAGTGVTFYPDPNHKWDGRSLP